MNCKSAFFSLALLGLIFLAPSSAKADISNGGGGSSGPTVTIQGTFDSTVVGPVSGTLTAPFIFDGYTFIFAGNTITFLNSVTGTYPSAGGFNGFTLTFAGLPAPITGVTNDPGSQLDPNSISFTGNSFSFDLSGLSDTAGQKSIFDVAYGPATATPEPASALLLGLGLLGLGFIGLRRKTAKDAGIGAI